jgi:hypothetical protein
MVQKFITCFIFSALVTLCLTGQNVEDTKANNRDNPVKKYMRPSLTTIYINRGTDRSTRMMNIFNSKPVPGKFNDHNIASRSISVSSDARNVRNLIEPVLKSEVSRQIVSKWFGRNAKGEFSMDLIGERGMYNASDADLIKAKASQRKEALLKDAGENLLDRSYILVYDVKAILTMDEYAARNGYSSDREGYVAYYDCYVYKLDWNDSIAAIFYNDMWNDASSPNPSKVEAFNKSSFPITYITSVTNQFGNVESSQYKDHSRNIFGSLSEEELFANIYTKIMNETDVSLAQANEDFKVKVPVFATHPVRAKIGLKEGLTVDRRFFVYQFELDDNGKKIAKRKAVVRASSDIIDNRRMADGNSETSRFYQVAGRRIYEGMMLQENPDWGFGFTIGMGTNKKNIGEGLTITAEASVSQWAGKAISGLPSGLKIYIMGTLGLEKFLLKDGNNNLIDEYSPISASAGLSKDFNFFHHFVLVPYAGYGLELLSNTATDMDKDKYQAEYIQFGMRFGINVTYNFQLVGNAFAGTVVRVSPGKDNDNIDKEAVAELIKSNRKVVQFGGGIRYLF